MPKMTGQRNEALAELLDEDEEGLVEEDGPSKMAYEEHVARLRAEAEAQDRAGRLVVAQQQLAEYATQKEEDAAELLKQAEELVSVVGGSQDGQISNSDCKATFLGKVESLRDRLAQAAAEANAFATQHREDMERTKRSSAQAELPSDRIDAVEMKRPRENSQAEDDEELSDAELHSGEGESAEENNHASSSGSIMLERCKYIPLRLAYDERNCLRLLEAALNVSEYTDKVDILSWTSKNGRVHKQIQKICSILSGLVVAQDYKRGQRLIQSRDFRDNARFFQNIFEVGRRYKIMNPDKMRSEYGKMMYMLMDSADMSIQDLLDFECVCPLKTVASLLKDKNALQLLQDPQMEKATAEIVAGDRPRYEIQKDIKAKERAREALARKYSSRSGLTQEEILLCLYSISDNNSFLLYNRDPIDRMISYLKNYFKPGSYEAGHSLSISAGSAGARLSHSHERQYHYVLQTLTLWREISNDMFKLWYLADIDLLDSGNYYRLTDTGQGLNRVQQSPRVRKAIFEIIERCQRRIGHWVGSSVVHLGDHNVPNALMFIDKYTQVPRVLNPVVLVLDQIPKLYRDHHIRQYIDNAFGSVEACRKIILVDCFRHAFDGSGADNFFDAGSCIDGRLTSAWHWCNQLEKKNYYYIFKLAGFVGFDGDFQK